MKPAVLMSKRRIPEVNNILKKVKLLIVCAFLMIFAAGCGDKTELKAELENIKLTTELPAVRVTDCSRLEEADDEVYRQQLAACEMYIESYEITKTSDFVEKYKDDVKEDRVAYYCNDRRKELQLEISTALYDNIFSIVKSVEDCDNISAYIKRVNYDVVNFYDYYADYLNSNDKTEALCTILTKFYERTNVLAFRFMEDNREEIIDAALTKIEKNARANDSLNMYIAMNNEIVRALNNVFGGVPEDYAIPISEANIKLARKLLESDNDLTEEDIDTLMRQLGEPTEEPEETPTPEPTPEVTEKPEATAVPTPTARPTSAPVRTAAPVRQPDPTPAPPRPTPAPVYEPEPTDSYVEEDKQYTFTID